MTRNPKSLDRFLIGLALLITCAASRLDAQAPRPRELQFDRHGYPLPSGAVIRLGIPPALTGVTWNLAWTADVKQFVVADPDGVALYDSATGRQVESHPHIAGGNKTFAPLVRDGRTVLQLNGNKGALFDLASGETIVAFTLPSPLGDSDRKLYSLDLSATHRFLSGIASTASGPGVAWRYDLARDRYSRLINDRADLRSMRLSPDGKRAFATGGNAEPELFAREVGTDKKLWSVALKGSGTVRAVSADGRRLAISDVNGVTVFDAENGRSLLMAPVDNSTAQSLWAVDLSADSHLLALADSQRVAVWNIETGKLLHALPGGARAVAFSPDSKSLLAASAWVQKWNLETGKPAYPASLLDRPRGAISLSWSGDGRRLFCAWPGDRRGEQNSPDVLAMWDLATTSVAWQSTVTEHPSTVLVDHSGKRVRGLFDAYVFRSWDVADASKERITLISSLGRSPHATVFFPDGRLLVQRFTPTGPCLDVFDTEGKVISTTSRTWPARSEDSKVTLLYRAQGSEVFGPGGWHWDLLTNRALPPLMGGLAFRLINLLPTESRTCVAGRTIEQSAIEGYVWELLSGRAIAKLPADIPNWDRATLSRDGRWIAAAGESTVIVHDMMNEKAGWRVPVANASALSFSPDGSTLATACPDGTILLWTVPRLNAGEITDGDRLWKDLGADDAAMAWKGLWRLLDQPVIATDFLAGRMQPMIGMKDTLEHVARLDHARYPVREQAMTVLAGRGDSIEGDLLTALKSPVSEEQRTRLGQLLARLDSTIAPSGDTLRNLRCIWLLERLGTPAAIKLLEKMAGGSTGSRVTLEAKAAYQRATAMR